MMNPEYEFFLIWGVFALLVCGAAIRLHRSDKKRTFTRRCFGEFPARNLEQSRKNGCSDCFNALECIDASKD